MVALLNMFRRETARPEITEAEKKSKTNFFPKGSSGTEIFGGYFDEEYLQKLRGEVGADVYDEMRRSDSQVKMLLKVVKAPILSANQEIQAVDDSDEEIFIKEFVEHVLFDDISYPDGTKSKTWMDFTEEALTSMDFGYALFEEVNKIVMGHPKFGNYVGLKDLGWRSPKTIEQWNLFRNGGIESVEQIVDGDLGTGSGNGTFRMIGKFLTVISLNKEGDNYEGISELRSIYGNFFRKNIFQKLKAISVERNAIGVPKGTVPASNENSDAADEFEKTLQNFTSHELNYLMVSEGWDVDEFKLNFTADKIQEIIDKEDVAMTKSFLANFMELGLNGTGSFALGSDLSDIFLGGIEYYAKKISQEINKLIVKLVDMKFGKRAKYPKLVFIGINDKAGKEYAEIIAILAEKGYVDPEDIRLRSFIHKKFNLPELVESLEKDDAPEPGEQATFQEEDPDKFKKDLAKKKQKSKISVRGLIEAEADKMAVVMREGLRPRYVEYVGKLRNIMEKNDKSKWKSLARQVEMPKANQYKKGLKAQLTETSLLATGQANSELPISTKLDELDDLLKEAGVPKQTIDKVKNQAIILGQSQDDDLVKRAMFVFDYETDRTGDIEQITDRVMQEGVTYIDGSLVTLAATNSTSENVNTARKYLFQTDEAWQQIEGFEFFNPDPKSKICVNLAGRIFRKDDAVSMAYYPPLHHNCKSVLIPIFVKIPKDAFHPVGLQPTGTNPDGSRVKVEDVVKSKSL